MEDRSRMSRRGFLKRAAGAAVGGIAFPYIVPSSALGKDGAVAPSNRITMGCIGMGGQGIFIMRGFLQLPEVQVVAVCDVNKETGGYVGSGFGKSWGSGQGGREPAKRIVEEFYASETAAGKYKGCATYADFRELLGRNDIDTVMTAPPDHWHGIIGAAAARAGKDVYAEKPLAYTVVEGRAICEAVKKCGVVWQSGSQQRSDRNFRFACELVRNGRIGKVQTVKVTLYGVNRVINPTDPNLFKQMPVPEGFDYNMWLGPAPWAPYCPGRCLFNFRWISDYAGGQITDWAGHHIDIAQWGMGVENSGPVEIEGKGEFPKDGLYDTVENYNFTCKYAQGFTMIVESLPASYGGVRFEGSDGWIFVGRGKLEAEPKSILSTILGPNDIHLYKSENHLQNFIDCVRTRSETIVPAETGQRAITTGLLVIIAMKLGRKLQWDPAKERFVNDAQADRLLSRPMRSPWNL